MQTVPIEDDVIFVIEWFASHFNRCRFSTQSWSVGSKNLYWRPQWAAWIRPVSLQEDDLLLLQVTPPVCLSSPPLNLNSDQPLERLCVGHHWPWGKVIEPKHITAIFSRLSSLTSNSRIKGKRTQKCGRVCVPAEQCAERQSIRYRLE